MGNKAILGLDQSTSGTKALLVDDEGRICLKKTKEHTQFYPKPGWVEHDPMEIYTNAIELLTDVMAESISVDKEIIGLSITNQRETILFWDRETKKPLCNALVWQCRRGVDICEELSSQGYSTIVESKTGLKLDTYFSASKIRWAVENIAEVKEALDKETLCVGTVDAWLIFKLTDGEVFAADYTNASRTMLFNIDTLDWDDELIELFKIQRKNLPDLKSSNDIFGYVAEIGLSELYRRLFEQTEVGKTNGGKLPICGVIGDSQGALFGQQCYVEGMAKATYGTGSSIMMYTGERKVDSKNGLVTSVAWGMDGKVQFALEGLINSSGDTLKWVKDNLGLYSENAEVGELIDSIEDNEGVYIVPAFVGLGAPYWKPNARASIVGLSRKSNRAHIVRAAVESMAYQVYDLIDMMEKDSGLSIGELNADGGPTNNAFLMQLQADLLKTPVVCSDMQEFSVMGAILMGGLGLGLWKDFEALKALKNISVIYEPKSQTEAIDSLVRGWKEAVESVMLNS